jgi:hypothetical protein
MRNFEQLSERENKCSLYSAVVCKILRTLHTYSIYSYKLPGPGGPEGGLGHMFLSFSVVSLFVDCTN